MDQTHFFPIKNLPEFASEDKVESLLVLLSCLVMLRDNLLGLLWGCPGKRDGSLEKKRFSEGFFEALVG